MSDVGDSIGQGGTALFTPTDGGVGVSETGRRLEVFAGDVASGDGFSFTFAAPSGTQMAVGSCPHSRRMADDERPGLAAYFFRLDGLYESSGSNLRATPDRALPPRPTSRLAA